MKKLVLSAAVLLAAVCACQKEAPQQENIPVEKSIFTITVDASKAPVTKALEQDGNALKAIWAEGESVTVYLESGGSPIGTLEPTTFGTASTKLEGSIDAYGLSEGSSLVLIYPGDGTLSYLDQDGTLETISSMYDFASANVKVSSIADGNVSTSKASFTNLGAIVKFSLKNADGTAALPVRSLTISDNGESLVNECLATDEGWLESYGPVTVYARPDASDLTVALCMLGRPGPLCLTANADGKYYECLRNEAFFEAGKYYSGTVKMQPVSYTVAGAPDAVFDSGWDPTLTANDMSFSPGIGLYTFTKERVGKGAVIALKVVKNHKWLESQGGGSYPEGDNNNIYLTAWEAGDLQVTFNPVTHEVKAWIDYDIEPGEIPTVYTLCGDARVFGTNWYPADTANDMDDNGDGTWSKTYTGVEAGAVQFRVVKDRSWDNAVPDTQYDPYYYNIPSYGDLTITFNPSADDLNKITVEFTAAEAPVDTYTVAGSPKSLFGAQWDPSYTANDMTAVGNGTYIISYKVAEAIIPVTFKVVKNHSWEVNSWPEGNLEYSGITGPGTFTIIFDPETGEITPLFEAEEVTEDTYTVAGEPASVFGGEWNPSLTVNDMVLQDNGLYRKVYEWVPAGALKFKVVKNHSWDNEAWPEQDYDYNLPIGGTVTIDFNPETGEITVSRASTCTVVGAPEAIFVISDWVIDSANDMTLLEDGTYTRTFTGIKSGVDTQFKIVVNHSWNESYGDASTSSLNFEYTTKNANDLTISFNPETKEISCYQEPGIYLVGSMTDWGFNDNYMMKPKDDGTYMLTLQRMSIGDYEFKVTVNAGWGENYGVGGAPNGDNYKFEIVDLACDVNFVYHPDTHVVSYIGRNVVPKDS